jgi:hypothetical protein
MPRIVTVTCDLCDEPIERGEPSLYVSLEFAVDREAHDIEPPEFYVVPPKADLPLKEGDRLEVEIRARNKRGPIPAKSQGDFEICLNCATRDDGIGVLSARCEPPKFRGPRR